MSSCSFPACQCQALLHIGPFPVSSTSSSPWSTVSALTSSQSLACTGRTQLQSSIARGARTSRVFLLCSARARSSTFRNCRSPDFDSHCQSADLPSRSREFCAKNASSMASARSFRFARARFAQQCICVCASRARGRKTRPGPCKRVENGGF